MSFELHWWETPFTGTRLPEGRAEILENKRVREGSESQFFGTCCTVPHLEPPSQLGVVVVNTALRPQKPDGLLGTERAPLTSSDTQSRELSALGVSRPVLLFICTEAESVQKFKPQTNTDSHSRGASHDMKPLSGHSELTQRRCISTEDFPLLCSLTDYHSVSWQTDSTPTILTNLNISCIGLDSLLYLKIVWDSFILISSPKKSQKFWPKCLLYCWLFARAFFLCFNESFFVKYFKTKKDCDGVVYVLLRPVCNSVFPDAV